MQLFSPSQILYRTENTVIIKDDEGRQKQDMTEDDPLTPRCVYLLLKSFPCVGLDFCLCPYATR